MKKKHILGLIKNHSNHNEEAFRQDAYAIAKDFDAIGDHELSQYIMSLLSDHTQEGLTIDKGKTFSFEKLNGSEKDLYLPSCIHQDLLNAIDAIKSNIGVNKFLFEGLPGTGKSASVKYLASKLNKDIYKLYCPYLVNSNDEITIQNITKVFYEINSLPALDNIIILFDEIDALVRDEADDKNKLQQDKDNSSKMLISTLLNCIDNLDSKVISVATTNLFKSFNRATLARFDAVINFDRYTREDLLIIASSMLESFLEKFPQLNKNIDLFKKIINLYTDIPYANDLKSIIKSSIAFSDKNDSNDYLRRIYKTVTNSDKIQESVLKEQKFTQAQIQILL